MSPELMIAPSPGVLPSPPVVLLSADESGAVKVMPLSGSTSVDWVQAARRQRSRERKEEVRMAGELLAKRFVVAIYPDGP
jgi:hypothetical protein